MELLFIPLPLDMNMSSLHNIFLLFSFLLILLKISKRTKTPTDTTPKLPPGPPKLPLIGNLHNLVGGLPHHVLRDLAAKYGPLMHLQLGEVPVVVISSPDMAKEILVSRDPAFAARPHTLASKIIWYDHQDLIFAPYSDYWMQMRKICMMEFFSEKKVRSFTFIFQDEISQLTNSIRSSEGVAINLSDKIFAHLEST
ncbi:premnaspirodiene oxygenase-like [Coffea arabica]|uniref:Premnaspirodiene oxygenase-like n=1 Tax=Coffea arabica TaxID=13443 RepID=A0ABM4VMJ2_COFAR